MGKRGRPRKVIIPPPKAIIALREADHKFQQGDSASFPPEEFDRLTKVQVECCEGVYPHLVRCDICEYIDECHRISAFLGNRVTTKKTRGKNEDTEID